jgi:nitroimidazol reductase NimA-like FMN-containing flavoprotein (pyridoxamine 5'-phosphate oxidase superfamily)
MREDIQALICRNSHCVLATASGNRPHCSLMSYTADPLHDHAEKYAEV